MCLNYDKFVELMPSGKEYKATILRPDSEGSLEFQETIIPAEQPKILLLDMTEREQ